MRHLITARLKQRNTTNDGENPRILKVEFPDRDTAEAELRCIERLRRHRCGLPEIFWVTVDGERWCLSVYDLDGELTITPVEPASLALTG